MDILHLQSTKQGRMGKTKTGDTWVILNVVNRDASTPDHPVFASLKAFGDKADRLISYIKPVAGEDGKFITVKSQAINLNMDNVQEQIDLNGEGRISYIWADAKETVEDEVPAAPPVVDGVPFTV